MEALWYEVSPYLYSLGGTLTLAQSGSTLGVCSGALLLATAAIVLRLRWSHRAQRKAVRTPQRHSGRR